MRNTILVLTFLLCFAGCKAQQKMNIKFSAIYTNSANPDTIKLTVINFSLQTYYYSIGVDGLVENGWEGLLADINSLGKNSTWSLQPLPAASTSVKYVSKKEIYLVYKIKNLKKIRFSLWYFKKRDFGTDHQEILLPPM